MIPMTVLVWANIASVAPVLTAREDVPVTTRPSASAVNQKNRQASSLFMQRTGESRDVLTGPELMWQHVLGDACAKSLSQRALLTGLISEKSE